MSTLSFQCVLKEEVLLCFGINSKNSHTCDVIRLCSKQHDKIFVIYTLHIMKAR